MVVRYTDENPLRLAILGDSWVTNVTVDKHWQRHPRSPTGHALRSTVEKHVGCVDFTVAGFPGLDSWTLRELCDNCTIRNASVLSSGCYSLKRNTILSQCRLAGLHPIEDDLVDEDLDVVVIVIGSNEIMHYPDQWCNDIIENINHIRRVLTSRGVEVILCSLYLSEEMKMEDPRMERARRYINRELMREGDVIDMDTLFHDHPKLWKDSYHLTPHGYRTFGAVLGNFVVRRFAAAPLPPAPPGALWHHGDVYQVHCHGPSDGFRAQLLNGSYVRDEAKRHHGKEVYKKWSNGKEIYLFYCDDRWGEKWKGWWLGPDLKMFRSAYAFQPGSKIWSNGWRTHGRGLARKPMVKLQVMKVPKSTGLLKTSASWRNSSKLAR